MTATQFRKLALQLRGACESAHQGHPDFRVGGKIFATLGPGEKWGMVKLTPDQQASFMSAEPEVYQPASGAWGVRGATIVHLHTADKAAVTQALILAWSNVAPQRLMDEFDEQ